METKAKLKWSFEIQELGSDEVKEFKMGDTVEVIREVRVQEGKRQFIIYSEELNESTVVFEDLLSFFI